MTSQRALDLCGAILGLVVSLPLLIVVAIAVKLESAGPVLFTQVRVGRRGRRFKLYKFRSMVVDAAAGAPITGEGDPRITRVGRIIRPLRLDELPQLFNVLRGEMSLVGPRPEAPAIVERYTTEQREILEVRPGITGPTQLAWLDEAAHLAGERNSTDYYVGHILPRKLATDLEYVRTRTFAGDVRILLKTPVHLARFVLGRYWTGRLLNAARLSTDFVAVALATYLAFFARFDGQLTEAQASTFILGLPLQLLAYALPFFYFKTYRSIWRYAGVQDFWQIAKACVIGGAISAALMHMTALSYPRAVLVVTPGVALLLLGGARLTWRSAATAFAGNGSKVARHRVVIVGAGRTGASVAREILSAPNLACDVVGFVDDDRRLNGAKLHNLPVLGTTEELPQLAQKHRLNEAIIAIPRPRLDTLRRIRDACIRAGLRFKTLPSVSQLVSGDGQVVYLRQVDVDELLQREPVPLQVAKIEAFLEGKRIMVTGAGGSIGSELCRQIVRLGAESLLMVERAENPLFALCAELQASGSRTKLTAALADIKHILRMSELFTHFRPQIVFHTAAYKHVPMLEAHPAEAVLNNVVGTARLANLANAHAVEAFVFISTDKAVRPSNLMGATKRICELYLMALQDAIEPDEPRGSGPRFRIVRFGNVLGSAGSALPLFQQQIQNGGPITITDPEVSRFFMTIEEAVGLVLESTTLNMRGGVAVLDMGQPLKITELADDLVTALGLPPSAVPRQVIGLRPGEKLHEALWDDIDEVLPSPHPRITVVRPRVRSFKEMDGLVRELEQLAVDGNIGPLMAKVHEIVPSYEGRLGAVPCLLRLDAEPRKPLSRAGRGDAVSGGRRVRGA
jgi:FlaA1/EpsC-like NDP-sugar epimerase/lipopolysaccharide/colanic/teichoic acid biosynthesis glycosyltransferase